MVELVKWNYKKEKNISAISIYVFKFHKKSTITPNIGININLQTICKLPTKILKKTYKSATN